MWTKRKLLQQFKSSSKVTAASVENMATSQRTVPITRPAMRILASAPTTSSRAIATIVTSGNTWKEIAERKKRDQSKKQEKAKLAVGDQESNIKDYISEDESYTCELGLVTIEELPEGGSNEDTKNKEESQPVDETALMCLVDCKKYPSFTTRTSYGDTGASNHMRMSLDGMYDLEDIQEEIGGVGAGIKATRKGKFKGFILQANG